MRRQSRRADSGLNEAAARDDETWCPPHPDCTVTEVFQYEVIPEGDTFPRFPIIHAPRWKGQTDAQYEAALRQDEYWARALGIMLGLAWEAATFLGLHETCRLGGCRRKRRCAGRKHEYDWSFPGPWMPPCAEGETMETIRAMIRSLAEDANEADKALARKVVAEREERKRKADA